MSSDGLTLQSPIQISQKTRLNAKAGLGGGGHLCTDNNLRLHHFCLRETGAVVAFGTCWRGSFLPR